MTKSNHLFTITPPGHSDIPDSSEPASPKGSILKTVTSSNGRISTNPNWKSPSENGPFDGNDVLQAKKKVRHSIISMDSTFDPSELELPLPKRVRCQRRLSVLLHTHVVLIIVCTLAILDAGCVIGQLICDILIMREKLENYEFIDEKLTPILFMHIPHLNESIHEAWNLQAIYDVLLGVGHHAVDGPITPPPHHANLSMRMSDDNSTFSNETMEQLLALGPGMTASHRARRAAEPKVPGHEVDHGLLYTMTHTCHLSSMVILSVLLLETFLKVFAMGKKLKHHKLEIFDALVVTISWCLDVGFYEGIWAHPGTTAATLLIILLPWRVVRIVNSFVLVIQEKDHVQLKIVKQRLRQSVKKTKETSERAASYRHESKALAGLCRKLGASESEIAACSPSGRAGRRGSIHSVLERAASLTFISTMSSVNSVPGLFDMGDISSDEDDDDIGNHHKDLDRTTSNNLTLRSGRSSTTLDSGSGVFILEVDENGLDNPVFDEDGKEADERNNNNNKKSNANSITNGNNTQNKADVERMDSNSSSPPEYHIAVSKTDSNTRL